MSPPISNAEKLACAKRELRMRERVYPRWIAEGRMIEDKARYELALIRAIVSDYEKLVEGERLL